jgi:hypothetical protein
MGRPRGDFAWEYGGIRIGRLNLPAGFKVENYNYREGIVTTLLYEDGSRITLQSGGMYGLPLFKGAEYVLTSTAELGEKNVRAGQSAKWRHVLERGSLQTKESTGKANQSAGSIPA